MHTNMNFASLFLDNATIALQ